MALSDILKAAADEPLKTRMAAAAASIGISSTRSWVEQNAELVAAHEVANTDQRIADVWTYWDAQVKAATVIPQPAGANPDYVTDAQLLEAVRAVHALNTGTPTRPDGNTL